MEDNLLDPSEEISSENAPSKPKKVFFDQDSEDVSSAPVRVDPVMNRTITQEISALKGGGVKEYALLEAADKVKKMTAFQKKMAAEEAQRLARMGSYDTVEMDSSCGSETIEFLEEQETANIGSAGSKPKTKKVMKKSTPPGSKTGAKKAPGKKSVGTKNTPDPKTRPVSKKVPSVTKKVPVGTKKTSGTPKARSVSKKVPSVTKKGSVSTKKTPSGTKKASVASKPTTTRKVPLASKTMVSKKTPAKKDPAPKKNLKGLKKLRTSPKKPVKT